jgi:hypothetical protein
MEFKFRSDLKDFQIARLMYWGSLEDKTPIPKHRFELIKMMRKHGFVVFCCRTICVVGYPIRFGFPNSYKEFDENDWWFDNINSEVLELDKDFVEEDNFDKYKNGI